MSNGVPGHRTDRLGVTPPTLDEAEVLAWQNSGTELIDLLTEARELGPLSRLNIGSRQIVLATGPAQVQHILA